MNFEVRLEALSDLNAVATRWRELEARSQPNFFLSWNWIGPWARAAGDNLVEVSARRDGKVFALALFGRTRRTRYGVVSARQLRLHECGNPDLNSIEIEHNGVLSDASIGLSVLPAIFAALVADRSRYQWDELVLSGVPETYVRAAAASGLAVETDRISPRFAVDLSRFDGSFDRWLASLSPNTRSQLRRAYRFAERFGPIRLERAASSFEAETFFEGLTALHRQRWQSRGKHGAFHAEIVNSFHRNVIDAGVSGGCVDLMRLTGGASVLGYLYNFSDGVTVSNYQGGFAYSSDNRHRPGLLAHSLCIENAMCRGLRSYDFLAGDSRYKRSLARISGELVWCRAQAPHAGLAIERVGRNIKRLMLRS